MHPLKKCSSVHASLAHCSVLLLFATTASELYFPFASVVSVLHQTILGTIICLITTDLSVPAEHVV